MTKQDVLNGARGKPVPFTGPDGFACLLRPLKWGERKELLEWLREHGEEPGSAMLLQEKFIVAAVCDESGAPILTAEDLNGFDGPTADAVANEVAKRNGLDGKAGEPGKSPSPATTS